jgi:RimJ/RimL family protein N-acetyltransferase
MSSMKEVTWQPCLFGDSFRVRPLFEADFDTLFAAASDPLIWEQHPDSKRYTRERFEVYFRSGIESKGALAIVAIESGQIVGSSRYTDYNDRTSSVEIGFTFLTRPYWGGAYNRELKSLMLNYAFRFVETAYFVVGSDNHRSRKAMNKIGGLQVEDVASTPVTGDLSKSVVFQINKSEWNERNSVPPFSQPLLTTPRLTLEPIIEDHAPELWELFSDLKLHEFVPYEPLSLEKQRERCAKWAKRRSLDGAELWLNWMARDLKTKTSVGHFQVGVQSDGVASVGYVVARNFQNRGFATESLHAVFAYLKSSLGIGQVKAWIDTRNLASQRLAQKMGMKQVEVIKNANFFKGSASDEYVFAKDLR